MWSAMTRSEGLVEIGGAQQLRGGLDQMLEQVDVVVRVHALHHGADALQAHAGVHRGLGQRHHAAVGRAVELHEDQVPDLDVPVAVFIGRARRAAGDVRAVVEEDLGAGAAGAGVAHGPEVGFLAQARQAIGGHAHLVDPDPGGLVIVLVDGDPQAVAIQAQRAGEEVPREADGVALEVVAEAEVAQHLEEGVMPRGVAHVLQVVVLAAGAHAALARCRTHIGARVLAQEHILELDHAGVGEQQGGIVARHQRTGGDDRVGLACEVVEECAADFGGGERLFGCHGSSSTAPELPRALAI